MVTISKRSAPAKKPPAVSVDQLVGIRLKAALAASKVDGARFGRDLAKFLGSGGKGWNRQTVYEAGQGKRKFRVAELVAFARALSLPAHYFLDAAAAGEETVGDGAEAIDAEGLRNLFRIPEPRSAERDELVALRMIDGVVDQLQAEQRELGDAMRLLRGTYWEDLYRDLGAEKKSGGKKR
jgi:hypothetical protein